MARAYPGSLLVPRDLGGMGSREPWHFSPSRSGESLEPASASPSLSSQSLRARPDYPKVPKGLAVILLCLYRGGYQTLGN